MYMFTSSAQLQNLARTHHDQLIADAARSRRARRSRHHQDRADAVRQPALRLVSLRSS